jgi:hypothetical protein
MVGSRTTIGSGSDSTSGVAIDAAGRMVVAGYSSQDGTGFDLALARYTETGSLDLAEQGCVSLPLREPRQSLEDSAFPGGAWERG